MTTELYHVTMLAVFTAMMWVPYIVGVNMHPSEDVNADFVRPRDLNTVPPWVHRAHRAHLNLLEQFVPMALLVIIAHQIGVSNWITVWCVIAFFWIRLVHAIGMVSGYAGFPYRSIVFSLGWLCTLIFASQLLLA